MRYRLDSAAPKVHPGAFVADSADLIGDVEIRSGASIWFNSVLRGDNDRIIIGENSNIQDGSVIHTDPGIQVVVEDNVTVGHRVVLHGCRVGAYSLVGINSVILNEASIGPWCLIGANTMITGGKSIPERSLVLGSPGKVVRELTDEECRRLVDAAKSYRDKASHYLEALAPAG